MFSEAIKSEAVPSVALPSVALPSVTLPSVALPSEVLPVEAVSPGALLGDFSLEMTGKDVGKLHQAAATIPAGTRINVTFLANEDAGIRLEAARAVRQLAFRAGAPHLGATAAIRGGAQGVPVRAAIGRDEHVFTVAGDPPVPEGLRGCGEHCSFWMAGRIRGSGRSASRAIRRGTR